MSDRDEASPGGSATLDIAFLRRQTFGDADLAREVLGLFLKQAASLVPTLPALPGPQQTDKAHLLKGSCLGIGALAAAELLQRYGEASRADRPALQSELEAVFARTAAAIEGHLAAT